MSPSTAALHILTCRVFVFRLEQMRGCYCTKAKSGVTRQDRHSVGVVRRGRIGTVWVWSDLHV